MLILYMFRFEEITKKKTKHNFRFLYLFITYSFTLIYSCYHLLNVNIIQNVALAAIHASCTDSSCCSQILI